MQIILVMNFLLAISSTIGMTIVPFLVTDSLGYSLMTLGLIEGSTELLSNILRLSNGIFFDKIKNKNLLFIYATGIALFSKTLLFIPKAWSIIGAKMLERVSNGAFASPRDACVASLSGEKKGRAMGLLNISKSAGCIIGPIVVSFTALLLGDVSKNVWIFVAICFASVLPAFILSFFMRAEGKIEHEKLSFFETFSVMTKIEPILILTFLFFLGRFNDGLLMIYLKQNGFPQWFYLSTISIFNTIMILSSPFIGSKIDSGKNKQMLWGVMASIILFELAFYNISGIAWTLAITGLLAWGIQRCGSQIVLSSLIFKNTQKHLYGTAIGAYYLVSGLGTLIASTVCGHLAMNDIRHPLVFSGVASLCACAYILTSKKV